MPGDLAIFDKMAYVSPMTEEMTDDEFRTALDKLDISQLGFSKTFGIGARTARRWALGEARIPMVVAMLLRLMLKKKLKLEVPTPMNEGHRVWSFSASKLE
jgi:DNA-binding transcriptional regulator YiaG